MARIPYLTRDDLAPENKDLLARDINLFRALAHAPEAARSFLGLAQHIRFKSRLEPRLRELAILQVGYMSSSAYEYSHHVKIGREFGVTESDLEGLIAESQSKPSKLEPVARAVLQAAREMTAGPSISQASFARLGHFFGNAQLVELVMIIGFYIGVVRMLASLEIDVEDEYKRFLAPLAPIGGAPSSE